MQKQLIGYTFDPKGYEVVFDKEAFIAEGELIGEIGNEMFHIFEGNNIAKYRSVVIYNTTPERMLEVARIYKIEPSEQITYNGVTQYIFKFVTPISNARYNTFGRNLAEICQGDYQHFYFFKDRCTDILDTGLLITEGAVNGVFSHNRIADTINEAEESMFNTLPIEEIAKKLKYFDPVDTVLNLAPTIGYPFNLAVHVLGDLKAAMLFANKYYGHTFITDDAEASAFIVDGVFPKSNVLVESGGGYKMDSGKGLTQITDFLIAVHYRIIKDDGENIFVVSIIPHTGAKVEHIEWKNTSSDTGLADFLMRFGGFHIGGGRAGVTAMHKMITDSKVPIIHTIPQYGFNTYKGQEIIVGYDGVFDLKTKKMFQKNEKFGFYFIGGNDGIMINKDAEAGAIQPVFVPKVTAVQSGMTYDDLYKITSSIYRNETAHILLMFACSMAGVTLYHKGNKTPSYYVTGVTGTGKTSFAECLYTMFGVSDIYGLRDSTAYPVKIMIAAFNKLPVFLNEFRSDMKYASEKLGYIQMAYDNSITSKGLRSGGTLSYKMTSQVFCEGEDTYSEGSIRTRSILHTLTRSGTTTGCIPKRVINENRLSLESFFGTYATTTNKKDYDKALKESATMFYAKGVEPRISDNISIMYAGCVTYAPEHKETFIKMCNYLIQKQVEDFQENGESQKMLKILAEYYGGNFCKIYIENNNLYVDWVEITMYMERFKRNMTLSIGAYAGHMEALGFERGDYEVEVPKQEFGEFATPQFKVIDGFRMELHKLPKKILNNQKINSEYKKARKVAH